MANGSIVNIDAATQPDLAQAMRGCSGSMGIVTQFKAKVHHMDDVWGGSCLYDESQSDELYAALHEYVGHGAEDPKPATIFTELPLGVGARPKRLFYFYDGPSPPKTGPFADFRKVFNLACVPKRQKYSELVSLKLNRITTSKG